MYDGGKDGCSDSKLEHIKRDWRRKSRPNFALFDPPPVKLREELEKCLSEVFG